MGLGMDSSLYVAWKKFVVNGWEVEPESTGWLANFPWPFWGVNHMAMETPNCFILLTKSEFLKTNPALKPRKTSSKKLRWPWERSTHLYP
jgi:hypothetical protein